MAAERTGRPLAARLGSLGQHEGLRATAVRAGEGDVELAADDRHPDRPSRALLDAAPLGAGRGEGLTVSVGGGVEQLARGAADRHREAVVAVAAAVAAPP